MTKNGRRCLLPFHNAFYVALACALNDLNKIDTRSQVAEVETPTITAHDVLPVGIIDADLGRRCRADADAAVGGIGIDNGFACLFCHTIGVRVNS